MAILILALVTYKDNSCPLAAMTSFVCKLFGRSKSDFSRSVTLWNKYLSVLCRSSWLARMVETFSSWKTRTFSSPSSSPRMDIPATSCTAFRPDWPNTCSTWLNKVSRLLRAFKRLLHVFAPRVVELIGIEGPDLRFVPLEFLAHSLRRDSRCLQLVRASGGGKQQRLTIFFCGLGFACTRFYFNLPCNRITHITFYTQNKEMFTIPFTK